MPGLRRWSFTYKQELWWHPWVNTVFYFPFTDDTNDVMGNATLSWWTYTKQTIWYLCDATSDINNVNISNDLKPSILTMVSWINVQSKWITSWTGWTQIMLMPNWNVCYQYYASYWTQNAFQVYKSNRSYTWLQATFPTNSWHLLTLTTSDTATVCYIDKTAYTVTSSWWYYNENSWPRLWRSWTQVIHSNVIWESRTRTQQDVDDYYELTKTKYWL